jgi:hypothetical protein
MSVKIHDLFARKTGTTPAQFSDYWTGTHAPIAQRFEQIRHYIQCHRIEQQPLVENYAAAGPRGRIGAWLISKVSPSSRRVWLTVLHRAVGSST